MLDDVLFAPIVLVVIVTTLITLILKALVAKTMILEKAAALGHRTDIIKIRI